MVASKWKLGDGAQQTCKYWSKNLKNTRSIVINYQRNQRKLVSEEEDLLELNFDLDEMQKLFTMSIHPHVRSLLLSLVNELQNKMKKVKCDLTLIVLMWRIG